MKNKLLSMSFLLLSIAKLYAQNPATILAPKYINQGLLQSLPIPSTDNQSGPYDAYDGQTAKYVQNIQMDASGELLFFIIDDVIYDKNGRMINNIRINNTDPGYGSAEIAVTPNPLNCSQYYIITTTNNQNI